MATAVFSFSKKATLGFAVLCALALLSCKNNTEATTGVQQDQAPLSLSTGSYFYASQTPSALSDGAYNYHFVRFELKDSSRFSGVFYHSPYGTDGSKGSFTGVLQAPPQLIVSKTSLAEGERYTETQTYTLMDTALGLGYATAEGPEATLPMVDEVTFNRMFKAYQQQQLNGRLNTTDRSRLRQLSSLKADMGYTDEDMEQLRFMEAMVDLDNDPSEMEYLLYIIDPMLCGSGGCNLYLLKSDGTEIGRLSVTRPPIYTSVSTIEDTQRTSGTLRPLYVYSAGMRRVIPNDGVYPGNPSLLNPIEAAELQSHPEQYQLIMDYLDTEVEN
jgi:hypothetical protein